MAALDQARSPGAAGRAQCPDPGMWRDGRQLLQPGSRDAALGTVGGGAGAQEETWMPELLASLGLCVCVSLSQLSWERRKEITDFTD